MKKVNLLSKAEMKNVLGGVAYAGSGDETVLQCTTRVYQAAKKACEADSVCDTMCDILPRCHENMAIAAAAACVIAKYDD